MWLHKSSGVACIFLETWDEVMEVRSSGNLHAYMLLELLTRQHLCWREYLGLIWPLTWVSIPCWWPNDDWAISIADFQDILMLLGYQKNFHVIFVTWGQFWPLGNAVACICMSVCMCVCLLHDNSSPIQARITKCGPEVQNSLVEIMIVLGNNWHSLSRWNLT